MGNTDISAELCGGLEQLAGGLRRCWEGLGGQAGTVNNSSNTNRLFGKLWRGVARAVDEHVAECILSSSPATSFASSSLLAAHVFAEGGAEQFDRDMQAIALLFRPYTSHPEIHFRWCVFVSFFLHFSMFKLANTKAVHLR